MEATPEQTAEGLAIVQVLATVLDRLVTANASLARTDPGQVTKFHAMKAPGIGILQYLERILKYASCSNECFIMALIYIDRLIQSNNFLLTELNVHRVVITAVLLAAKFFDDAYYNNAYYAKVGGVLVSEMNGLEVDFLFRINFTLHVTPDIFAKYRGELLAQSQVLSPPPPTMITAYTQTSYVSCVNPQQPPNGDAKPPQAPYNSVDPYRAPQHITPSPPADAAKMAQDQIHGMQYADAQLLHYRSNSMPEPAGTDMSWVPQRCAQSSFSAPIGVPAPYSSAPYNPNHLMKNHDRLVAEAMANQILPLQEGLSHHHHGMYGRQKADPRLQPC